MLLLNAFGDDSCHCQERTPFIIIAKNESPCARAHRSLRSAGHQDYNHKQNKTLQQMRIRSSLELNGLAVPHCVAASSQHRRALLLQALDSNNNDNNIISGMRFRGTCNVIKDGWPNCLGDAIHFPKVILVVVLSLSLLLSRSYV